MNENIPEDLLKAIAKSKGRKPGEAVGAALPFSDAAARAEAARKAALKTGDVMEDGSIYLGRYAPVDKKGVSLGKTFNVFAAPRSSTNAMNYDDTVAVFAEMKEFLGRPTGAYTSARQIYRAIARGKYEGAWIIPPLEILVGSDPNRPGAVMEDNLYKHRETAAFAGTFREGFMGDHLSSTVGFRKPRFLRIREVASVYFQWSGSVSLSSAEGSSKSVCRPVRLEEIKP